jgi:WD40 repeat protein
LGRAHGPPARHPEPPRARRNHARLGLAFAPDGKTLATVAGNVYESRPAGQVQLWEVPTWRRRATLAGHDAFTMQIAFSPDGKSLATGGETHRLDPAGRSAAWRPR